jgi:hypothetical protein
MPLSEQQRLIAECPIRFRVVVAGRRGGKTHLAIRELCRFASKPGQIVWYLTNSRQQGKSLAWSKLKRKLQALNWIAATNESELSIELVNGSKICIKSAEQGDNLRGESLNFVCIDEFCDIDLETVWAQILRPSLSDKLGSGLFIGTPKAGNQYARDLYDNYLTKSGWMSFSYTTAEGGFVTEDEIKQAQQDLAPKVFAQEYLASWTQLSNVIFEYFGEHNIQPVELPKPTESLIVGMDFNVGKMLAQIGRQTRTGIEYFDEIVLENSNTTEVCDEIRLRYPLNPITVYPDASGQQRKTSAAGQTDLIILQNAGFAVKVNRTNPTVKDRINSANSLFFKREDGSTRFKIDPRCQFTIKSFKNWSYKEGSQGGIPDKESGWDHACDSGSYPIAFLFPIRRDIPARPPERWTVR